MFLIGHSIIDLLGVDICVEEVIRSLIRIECCLHGVQAGAVDRAGREAGSLIGVVGDEHVLVLDLLIRLDDFVCILLGRVRLELGEQCLVVQTVVEDRRHHSHGIRERRLRLHDRGEGDELVKRHAPFFHFLVVALRDLGIEVRIDLLCDDVGILADIEFIGIGEAVALHAVKFQRIGARLRQILLEAVAEAARIEREQEVVCLADFVLLKDSCRIAQGDALTEGHALILTLLCVAVAELLDHCFIGHRSADLMLTGDIFAVHFVHSGDKAEDFGQRDEVFIDKLLCDLRGRGTLRDHDDALGDVLVDAVHFLCDGKNADGQHRGQREDQCQQHERAGELSGLFALFALLPDGSAPFVEVLFLLLEVTDILLDRALSGFMRFLLGGLFLCEALVHLVLAVLCGCKCRGNSAFGRFRRPFARSGLRGDVILDHILQQLVCERIGLGVAAGRLSIRLLLLCICAIGGGIIRSRIGCRFAEQGIQLVHCIFHCSIGILCRSICCRICGRFAALLLCFAVIHRLQIVSHCIPPVFVP